MILAGRLRPFKRRWGVVLGGAVAGLGCAAFSAGLLDRLDHFGLDLHFRYCSVIAPDPRIVLIDIDDRSLRAGGDWPWHRREYARLVDTLDELGAAAIVLDLVLAGPSPPRIKSARLSRHYDIDSEVALSGDPATDPIVYDDDELRDAMARAGNVYLAMFGPVDSVGRQIQDLGERALSFVRDNPKATLGRFLARFGTADPSQGEADFHRAHVMRLLEQDFGLEEHEVVERLQSIPNVDPDRIQAGFVQAKRRVARRAAHHFFEQQPHGRWRDFFEQRLSDQPFDAMTPDREELLTAFRAEDARRTVLDLCPAADPTLSGRLARASNLTAPLAKLVRAAKGVGIVSYDRDQGGGVLRSLPMVVESDGAVVSQLGFLVACHVLGFDVASIRIEGNRLTVGQGTKARQWPVDVSGATLLNWHLPSTRTNWRDSFEHIPAARPLEIAANREAVEDNARRLGIAMADLVEQRHARTPAEYARYAKLVNRCLALRGAPENGPTNGQQVETEKELASLDQAILRLEDDAIVWLKRAWQLWKSEEPRDDAERQERQRIRRLHETLAEGRMANRLDTVNAELERRTQDLLNELRPKIANRICLVGYTASGAADLVATPIHSAMPGVMVHANVINMLLQDRPAFPAPYGINLGLMLMAGLAVAVITATRGPLVSLCALGTVASLIILIGVVVFRSNTVHLSSPVAIVVTAVVWASVTVYRQLTVDRTRRQLQRALGQYTSPAVAARIVKSVEAAHIGPEPARVTCFFSDLQGFTRLSERLGPERTRLFLNPYLGVVSRALVSHGAMVNKFLGDGVFAFFNAPIRPCRDHARAGCAAALEAVEALHKLNPKITGDAAGEPLVMRIGISTGNVFVGDYGSDAKLDYTCIGDTVNVASRLQTANKVLGTTILVDEATHRQANDRFAFRTLGLLGVSGRIEPVSTYELVACLDHLDGAQRDYIALFEKVVRHYQAGEWESCLIALTRCRDCRPGDRAVDRYEQEVARHRAAPPAPNWNRALALTAQ